MEDSDRGYGFPSCYSCFYNGGVLEYGYGNDTDIIECKRYPKTQRKPSTSWCGEHPDIKTKLNEGQWPLP